MRMRTTGSLAGTLLLGLLLGGCSDTGPVGPEGTSDAGSIAAPGQAASGVVAAGVTQNLFIPAGGTFYNVCTDEFVGFSEGAGFHIIVRATETNQGWHLGFHENGVNLNGPGLANDGGSPGEPTGTWYHGMLRINETWNIQPPFPESYSYGFQTVVNATGDALNRVQHRMLHVTVDAQGGITAWVDQPFATECRG